MAHNVGEHGPAAVKEVGAEFEPGPFREVLKERGYIDGSVELGYPPSWCE